VFIGYASYGNHPCRLTLTTGKPSHGRLGTVHAKTRQVSEQDVPRKVFDCQLHQTGSLCASTDRSCNVQELLLPPPTLNGEQSGDLLNLIGSCSLSSPVNKPPPAPPPAPSAPAPPAAPAPEASLPPPSLPHPPPSLSERDRGGGCGFERRANRRDPESRGLSHAYGAVLEGRPPPSTQERWSAWYHTTASWLTS